MTQIHMSLALVPTSRKNAKNTYVRDNRLTGERRFRLTDQVIIRVCYTRTLSINDDLHDHMIVIRAPIDAD